MESSEILLYLMIGCGIFGVIGTVAYYFARYAFKTDHDRDIQPLSEDGTSKQVVRQATPTSDATPSVLTPTPTRTSTSTGTTAAPTTPPIVTFESALVKTKANLFGRLRDFFHGQSRLSKESLEALEEILYTSDLGAATVQRLLDAVDEKISRGERVDLERVREALRIEMMDILAPLVRTLQPWTTPPEQRPQVWLIVGVNGAGKTTSIGKLAHEAASRGLKVLVAAGDTFRAAAQDQLAIWTERAQVELFSPAGVSDPAAVAFAACQKAVANKIDLVIIDTAGRLHTQVNLMEELKKVKRVIQKLLPQAPHETLIVLDANSGQNALVQAKQFHEALDLTGAIITKMDGTAKGGVALGLACELKLSPRYLGIGEGVTDLRPFDPTAFVNSIL